MSIRKTLGENVRRRRLTLGISQEALAARIHESVGTAQWDQGYVSRIESGQVNATLETLEQLAAALDTTAAHLISRPE